MSYIDVIGWIAAALTLMTFAMKTMLPLRVVAVSSNIAFIFYGALAGFYPALGLHCVLLPFNIYRIYEIRKLTRKIRNASGKRDWSETLQKVMSPRRFKSGEILFRRGDKADRIYLLAEGRIELSEISKEIEAGQLFGEVAFFLPARERTLTARCLSDCKIMEIDEQGLKMIYFQNPEFGFSLIELIASRMAENLNHVESVRA